jgi:elongation factor Ts
MLKLQKKDIIYLRKLTHESISKCKDALIKSKGNVEEAVSLLKNTNFSINQNIDISNNEGIVMGCLNNNKNKGILLKINCLTDFVSRNSIFIDFVNKLKIHALYYDDLQNLLSSCFEDKVSIQDELLHLSNILGEYISLTGFQVLYSDIVYLYNHFGNKLSSLVGVVNNNINQDNLLLYDNICHNLCMQVAAMNPLFLRLEDIPKNFIQGQVDLITSNIINSKVMLERVINSIIQGKMNKIYKKIVLMEQIYIKDHSINIKQYINNKNCNIVITGFKRLSIR